MIDKFPRNVTDIIVSSNMCIGCGVCAGVCPVTCLEMRMENGEYKPFLVSECLPECDLCLEACPFFDHDTHQDDLAKTCFGQGLEAKVDPIVGYYLDCFIGYSKVPGHREQGSSGGMVTWLLERLLNSGEIDRVVTVRARTCGSGSLFEMAVIDNVQSVRNAAGSRYYPVELSVALQHILTDNVDCRYAIVGLPCFLYGIRRSMFKHRRLRRRVKYLLGLACGLCPSAYYTEALCAWVGVPTSKVQTVGYRFKDRAREGWDFGFRSQHQDGRWSRQVGFMETYPYLWGRSYFVHNTCNYCDDVFAEAADVVFMDAWLPDLISDTRGTSIIVARHPRLRDFLTAGIEEENCALSPCPIKDVLTSQEAIIKEKRQAIWKRIFIAREQGKWLPKMRTEVMEIVSLDDRQAILRRMRTMRASKILWPYFKRLPTMFLPLFFGTVDIYAGNIVYGVKSLFCVLKTIIMSKNRKKGDVAND